MKTFVLAFTLFVLIVCAVVVVSFQERWSNAEIAVNTGIGSVNGKFSSKNNEVDAKLGQGGSAIRNEGAAQIFIENHGSIAAGNGGDAILIGNNSGVVRIINNGKIVGGSAAR